MRPNRPKFDRYRNRQQGTRRQVLETALAQERAWLWQDYEEAELRGDTDQLIFLAHRIRCASEALGYPSSWESIPPGLLHHYECVETVWPLGITAQRWDPGVLAGQPYEMDDELRATLSRLATSWLDQIEGDLDGE